MIAPNATQLRAQAIEIHRSGSGWWNLYDARGALVAQLQTRDAAIGVASVKFHVRDAEWSTTQVECCDDDDCRKCGGHGAIYLHGNTLTPI